MRLRKLLRGRSLKCVEFQSNWKEAGLDTRTTNKEIKEYLKEVNMQSDVIQKSTVSVNHESVHLG